MSDDYRCGVLCYVIAERPQDLSTISAVLSDLGIEVVEPARAFDRTSHRARGWLPEVDFVCVLFQSENGWETPTAVYLEIGEAVGAGTPVLLIAEPPRRLDPALSTLPVVRVPAGSRAALTGHISMFLQSIGREPAPAAPPRALDRTELDSVREELDNLRVEVEHPRYLDHRKLEQLALRLLRATGAEAEEITGTPGIGDFAAWVPGTERFIPGPLLVELRILQRGHIDRSVLDQLQLYALTRDAQWSMLIYYRWERDQEVQLPRGGTWPMVMVFDIEDLAGRLRGQSLAQVLNNERNAIVHGVERR
jgi:hypothetical protein